MEKRNLRLKKKNAALLGAGCIALIAGAYMLIRLANPVIFKTAHPSVEQHEDFDPKDTIASVFLGSINDVVIEGEVDTNTIGEYKLTYLYKDHSYTQTVIVSDFTPPELELKQVNADIYEEIDADTFVESCKDDSKVSITITNPDALAYKPGTRSVTIQAKDEYGNITQKSTTLTRFQDTEAPVVKEPEDTRHLEIGEEYINRILTITDNMDTECTIDVDTSGLNVFVEGIYTVPYTITDRSGNQTVWNETVIVGYPQIESDPASENTAESDYAAENEQNPESEMNGNGEGVPAESEEIPADAAEADVFSQAESTEMPEN